MCRRETAWESRYCRNAKRSPFVCVLVWVYFEHARFESGFRDLTLCVKVLRSEQSHQNNPNQKRSKRTNKKHTTTTKTNQTEHRGVGSQPAMGITCMMTSCMSFREWPPMRSKTEKTQKHKKGPGKRVKSNTAQSGNQGSPQPGSPRSQRAVQA